MKSTTSQPGQFRRFLIALLLVMPLSFVAYAITAATGVHIYVTSLVALFVFLPIAIPWIDSGKFIWQWKKEARDDPPTGSV